MTEKNKGGRPSFAPTQKDREQVKMLAGMGVPDYDICKVVGVSEPTMRKHFFAELETGHILANAQVAQTLFKMATDKEKPNVTACIFWLKTRGRWAEAQSDETGKKQQRDNDAKTSHKGTEWAELLTPAPGLQ